jgi:hypothetical protein
MDTDGIDKVIQRDFAGIPVDHVKAITSRASFID